MPRRRVQIKKEIVEGLKEFPMTTYGIWRYVNCHYNTALNRLQELEEDGVIEQNCEKWEIVDI